MCLMCGNTSVSMAAPSIIMASCPVRCFAPRVDSREGLFIVVDCRERNQPYTHYTCYTYYTCNSSPQYCSSERHLTVPAREFTFIILSTKTHYNKSDFPHMQGAYRPAHFHAQNITKTQ